MSRSRFAAGQDRVLWLVWCAGEPERFSEGQVLCTEGLVNKDSRKNVLKSSQRLRGILSPDTYLPFMIIICDVLGEIWCN